MDLGMENNPGAIRAQKTSKEETPKKKILIVHPIFLWGGAEQVLLCMIKSIHSSYDLHILTGNSLRKMEDKIQTRYNFNCGSYAFKEIINGWLFKSFPYLLKQIQQRKVYEIGHKFDLVVSSSGSLKSTSKTIEYIHYPRNLSGTRGKRRFAWIKKVIQKIILSNETDRSGKTVKIANSKWTRDNIKKDQKETNTIVIYPPVNTYKTRESNKDEFNIVSLSRISPDKYIETTISNFNALRKRNQKLTLSIIGSTKNCDKYYVKHIKELCGLNESIEIYLDVSESTKKTLLCKATYGLHSMPKEHFGIAIVEMMSFRMIPFVPNGGGQIEVVNNEMLTYSSKNDLLQKFELVLNNSKLRRRISNECYQRAQDFSEEIFMNKFSFLVSEIIGQ